MGMIYPEKCLREPDGRIIAWSAGFTVDEWEMLKKKYWQCYESTGKIEYRR